MLLFKMRELAKKASEANTGWEKLGYGLSRFCNTEVLTNIDGV
jgi:hypothetical protein